MKPVVMTLDQIRAESTLYAMTGMTPLVSARLWRFSTWAFAATALPVGILSTMTMAILPFTSAIDGGIMLGGNHLRTVRGINHPTGNRSAKPLQSQC